MKPLTKRLQTALDLLPACRLTADIGCDHGIAAEALLCQRKCQKVLACDISAPSLEKAKARLTRAGLAAHAEFFCCDGLAKANEADGALLLGMGGRTIVEILQKGRSLLPQMRGLVAGPAGHEKANRHYAGSVYDRTAGGWLWQKGGTAALWGGADTDRCEHGTRPVERQRDDL